MTEKKVTRWTKEEIENRSRFDPNVDDERSIPRYCAICGNLNMPQIPLCKKCYDGYGADASWVKELIRIEQQNYDRERKGKLDEISFSDMNWNDDKWNEEKDFNIPYYDPWDDVDASVDADLDLDNLLQILTPRETEVLHMLMDGYNDEEIAVKLNLPQPNISYYHKQIREKATNLGISRF